MTTMATIKILFTINSLEKQKKKSYSFKNTIYNSCWLKKHLIEPRKKLIQPRKIY